MAKLVESSVMLCALVYKSMTQEEKFKNKKTGIVKKNGTEIIFSLASLFLNEETFDACVGGNNPAWSKLIRLFRSGGHYHSILDLH